MDDITRAMLGDHEAADRLTSLGALLPCLFCGGTARLRRVSSCYNTGPTVIRDEWTVECQNGCTRSNVYRSEIFQDDAGRVIAKSNGAEDARRAWNTRAAVEMEGME